MTLEDIFAVLNEHFPDGFRHWPMGTDIRQSWGIGRAPKRAGGLPLIHVVGETGNPNVFLWDNRIRENGDNEHIVARLELDKGESLLVLISLIHDLRGKIGI